MSSFQWRHKMATSELVPPGLAPYSQTDLLNRKFKRLTWLISFIFVIVFVLLIFELMGVLPISPFQPDIKNRLSVSEHPRLLVQLLRPSLPPTQRSGTRLFPSSENASPHRG